MWCGERSPCVSDWEWVWSRARAIGVNRGQRWDSERGVVERREERVESGCFFMK